MWTRTKLPILLFFIFAVVVSLYALPTNDYKAGIHIAVVVTVWSVFFVLLQGKQHGFLALNAFLIFSAYVVAHRFTFDLVPAGALMVYALLAMTLTVVYVLLFQLMPKKLRFVATIICVLLNSLVIVVPLVYIIYFLYFNTGMSPDVIRAVLQTNLQEAIGFLTTYLNVYWVVLILVVTLIFSFGMYTQGAGKFPAIKASFAAWLILVLSLFLYMNKADLLLVHYVYSNAQMYEQELERYKELQASRNAVDTSVISTKEGSGELYVVVIGESLNKMHMGIYGYPRNTTPFLQKLKTSGELLIFRNAYSIHTHSMPVLSQALTRANQSNKENYFESVSVLEVLRASEFETWWLTNQMLYGLYDSFITVLAQNADHMIALNENVGVYTQTQHHDGELINHLETIIDSTSRGNRMIFVHLMGSHWPYCDRFPRDYEVFKLDLDRSTFGALAGDDELRDMQNCYDNSVLYNDYVISSILGALNNTENVSGLLYFSDHADDVFEKLGHHADKFTYSMTQIPVLAWFSDSYKDKYPDKYRNMKANRDELLSNDFIYDTVLGFGGIHTEKYEPVHDISNSGYFLDPSETEILDGEQNYASANNVYYQQTRNLAILKQMGLLEKVGVLGIETLGKLAVAIDKDLLHFKMKWQLGLSQTAPLTVGDEQESPKLTALLSSNIANTKPKTFLVEVTHSYETDNEDIINALQTMYRGKMSDSETLVALPFRVDPTPDLRSKGYRVIRRIDREDLVRTLSKPHGQGTELSSWIEELAKRQVSGILIDSNLYPQVRKLLDQLPKSQRVPIYIEAADQRLHEPNFVAMTQQHAYWKDPEVKVIMVDLLTPFER